jgi:hypothetical protein
LKVALENQLYDMDNLTGQIRVIGRVDRLDLAVLSREFALQFELAESDAVRGEIRLEATVKDLAAEILEIAGETPGCTLTLRFYLEVADVAEECARIEQIFQEIWQPMTPPVQILTFVYGEEKGVFGAIVEHEFHRQITEEQMGDIPELLQHVIRTLTELVELVES